MEGELEKAGHGPAGLRIIDDPAQASRRRASGCSSAPDLLAVSADPAGLRFGDGGFAKTPFGER